MNKVNCCLNGRLESKAKTKKLDTFFVPNQEESAMTSLLHQYGAHFDEGSILISKEVISAVFLLKHYRCYIFGFNTKPLIFILPNPFEAVLTYMSPMYKTVIF